MNRAWWVALAVVVVLVALFYAFRPDSGSGSGPDTEFTGVITDIESSGLNEVTSFVVRHDGTTSIVYVREDFDYGFPIGHLQAHLTSGDPVIVVGTVIEGKLFADSIVDA